MPGGTCLIFRNGETDYLCLKNDSSWQPLLLRNYDLTHWKRQEGREGLWLLKKKAISPSKQV